MAYPQNKTAAELLGLVSPKPVSYAETPKDPTGFNAMAQKNGKQLLMIGDNSGNIVPLMRDGQPVFGTDEDVELSSGPFSSDEEVGSQDGGKFSEGTPSEEEAPSAIESQLGLRTGEQIEEGNLLEKKGISSLNPGGFAHRDELRAEVRGAAHQEKRLKRVTNLAYRDAMRRGDTEGARQIALDSMNKGISFGGISQAGDVEANLWQERGEQDHRRRQLTGQAPNAVQQIAQGVNQGSQRSTDIGEVSEGISTVVKGGKAPRTSGFQTLFTAK